MKINLPQLVNLLSLSSGRPRQECEKFLDEFFKLATEVLSSGENVKIKGFGTFKIVEINARKSVNVSNGQEYEIPGHSRIVFVASRELASIVNQPFEMFEAVEITDQNLDEWKDMENVEEEDDSADDRQNDIRQGTREEMEEIIEDGDDDGSSLLYEYKAEEPEESETGNSVDTDESVSEIQEGEEIELKGENPVVAVSQIPETVSENLIESGLEETAEDEETLIDDETSEEISEEGEEQGEDEDLNEDSNEDEEEDDADIEDDYIEETRNKGKRRYHFAWGFLAGFLVCVLVAGIASYIYFRSPAEEGEASRKMPDNDTMAVTDIRPVPVPTQNADSAKADGNQVSVQTVEEKEPSDEALAPSTKPSDEQVYDTVTTTRYLTTIAKDYYGNYNLWPYIYEENKAILGHPDRIRPGTKVVVPQLSKYGVDPKNPADIAKAKKKGVEIYARYKK